MDSDNFVIAVVILVIVGILFVAGLCGAEIKEQDIVKRIDSGMTPYVSPMKTLEWKSD